MLPATTVNRWVHDPPSRHERDDPVHTVIRQWRAATPNRRTVSSESWPTPSSEEDPLSDKESVIPSPSAALRTAAWRRPLGSMQVCTTSGLTESEEPNENLGCLRSRKSVLH